MLFYSSLAKLRVHWGFRKNLSARTSAHPAGQVRIVGPPPLALWPVPQAVECEEVKDRGGVVSVLVLLHLGG